MWLDGRRTNMFRIEGVECVFARIILLSRTGSPLNAQPRRPQGDGASSEPANRISSWVCPPHFNGPSACYGSQNHFPAGAGSDGGFGGFTTAVGCPDSPVPDSRNSPAAVQNRLGNVSLSVILSKDKNQLLPPTGLAGGCRGFSSSGWTLRGKRTPPAKISPLLPDTHALSVSVRRSLPLSGSK